MLSSVYDLSRKEEVARYISDKNLMNGGSFLIEEIGTGNMNYVFRITDEASEHSVILKYAAGHTRISEDILVSTDRIKIEARVLAYLGEHARGFIPHIYEYDDEHNCFLMEDYKGFSILRELLLDYHQIPGFAEQISEFLVKSLLPSSELVLDQTSMRELAHQFTNPLCDITKTYVFCEPFHAQGSTNAVFEPNLAFIHQEIYQDHQLLQEIELLKETFTGKQQALLHGDLHTGSIFSDLTSVVVFDYEFAFVGPIGFDIGNLTANLIFAWLHAKANRAGKEFCQWLEDTIAATIDLFQEKLHKTWEHRNFVRAAENRKDLKDYLEDILQDTASFAGVELIRRVIGIAHVADITSITSSEQRIGAERSAIRIAKALIRDSASIQNGSDLLTVLHENSDQVS